MKRLVTMIIMTLVTAGGMLAPTVSASAASVHAQREYCVVKLAPLPRNQVPSRTNHVFSRVISRSCSDQPARAGFIQAGTSAAAETPIWTEYSEQGIRGQYLQFQASVPCSGSGHPSYLIPDTFPSDYGAPWGAQSWLAQGGCWHTTIYTSTGGGGQSYTYAQGVYKANVIGAPWDKHIGSVFTGWT
jgi:hypothetical protein